MSEIEADDRGLIVRCPTCGQRNRLTYERLGEPGRCPKCRNELPLPAEPIELQSEEQFTAVTSRAALPVLVDFWAEWCGPCKMVAPEVAKVARAGAGRWLTAKLNTEEVPAPAQRLRVTGIPLFVIFRQGREIARQAGAMPAAHLQPLVENALGLS